MTPQDPPRRRFAAILGLVCAVGALGIDMYLPALPELARDMGGPAAAQATLVAFFIPFGLAQIIWGPLADAYGRRGPMMVGLGLFVLGALAAAVAPGTGGLLAARAVQGFGSAALMVIPRAAIRDRYTGNDGTRLMATVMLIISVSPLLAPLLGTALLGLGGWRAIFVALAVLGVSALVALRVNLLEMLPPNARVPARLGAIRSGMARLLRDGAFVSATLVGAFAMAGLFAFIATAAFVYIETFGLSEIGFSLAFAVNAGGFFVASQFAAPLSERIGPARAMRLGAVLYLAFAGVLTLTLWAAGPSLGLVVLGFALVFAALGLVVPPAMMLALDGHGPIAGLASSLGGTVQMVIAGIVVASGGPFLTGSPLPLAALITVCAAACCTGALIPTLSR